MIKATHYTTETNSSLSLDDIPEVLKTGTGMVWIDTLDPSEETLVELGRLFATASFVVDRDDRWRRRPRLRVGFNSLVVVAFADVGDSHELAEVDLTMGKGWLVSVRHSTPDGHAYDMAESIRRFELTRGGATDSGIALQEILEDIVDGYFDMVESVEDTLETIETSLFDDDYEDEELGSRSNVQHELLRLRRGLILMRRKVIPLREVLLELSRGETQWLDQSTRISLQTVLDHLLRLIDQIDTQRELLGNVVDAHLALQANYMNQIMKKMTSWAAVLVVATVITGVYGMNFTHMPELHWKFGYPLALALILGSTGGLWLYFKRKDWL